MVSGIVTGIKLSGMVSGMVIWHGIYMGEDEPHGGKNEPHGGKDEPHGGKDEPHRG